MTDAEFTQNADLELLRSELDRTQERYFTAAHQQRQAEELLARYLNTLYPVAYAQARARKVSVVAFAEEMFKAISRVQASENAGAEILLARYLETLFPAEYAQGIKQKTAIQELAEQLLPKVGTAKIQETASAPPPPAPVQESADTLTALRILGSSPDWEVVRRRWETETQKSEATYTKTLDALLEKGWIEIIRVPASDRLSGRYRPWLVTLTAAGRRAYQEHVGTGLAPIALNDFINERYKSREAWWLIRLTRALILEANDFPQRGSFTYEVYDPQDPLPAGFQKRYGNSEPDLILVLHPHGSQSLRFCIECERAKYPAAQLKSKLVKNVLDYTQAGFEGIYYIAPDRDAAQLIVGAVRKIAADLRENSAVLDRAFLAVFTADDLAGRWLPSPAQINRWFQPGKEKDETVPIPAEAAKPRHHFKYVLRVKEGDPHAN